MSELEDVRRELGLIQIYTGNGKGKTTAALGLALRASGRGLKVLILQFMKPDAGYGEQIASMQYCVTARNISGVVLPDARTGLGKARLPGCAWIASWLHHITANLILSTFAAFIRPSSRQRLR